MSLMVSESVSAPAVDRPDQPTQHEIAERAFLRYEARGSVWGHDVEDWLEAERELVAEYARRSLAGRYWDEQTEDQRLAG